MVLGISKTDPRLKDQQVFVWLFERFQCFNLETNLLISANPFQNLEYCILVESADMENATFSYKTPLSEADVKTNSIGSRK